MSKRIIKNVILYKGIRLVDITNGYAKEKAAISNAFGNWFRSDKEYLPDAYKSPSVAKQDAFSDCRCIYEKLKGYRFRFTSNGCQTFSVAFYCYINGERYFVWITKDSIRCSEFDDELWTDLGLDDYERGEI